MSDLAEQQAQRAKLRRTKRRENRLRAQGMLQGVIAMLTPDDIVFDCGANVGAVTAQLAPTGARIHAFEPDPLAFAALKDRLGDVPNVTLHNAAVGVRAGQAHLRRGLGFADDPTGTTTRSSLIEGGEKMDENPETWVEVTVIDLPTLIRKTLAERPNIALLKLDVEGAELEILETMEQDRLFTDIRLTIAETHGGKFKSLRPRFKALRQRIADAYPITKVNLDWM